jgi:purine catabolism regulator
MGGSVNVLSFLEDPAVRRGGPELLAGGENLLRRVHWVHISDQADIAGYLRGGEVLLTSGSGFPVGVEDQRSYIRSLASARVAALVVRADQDAGVIPPAMVSEAADHGLPLIRLNHRIPFVEVTRALHERLLDAELGFLRRTDHLRGELTRLLVQDRGLGALVEHIATALGRAVVVEDASGCVVAGSAIGMPDEDLLDLWMRRRHARGRPWTRRPRPLPRHVRNR